MCVCLMHMYVFLYIFKNVYIKKIEKPCNPKVMNLLQWKFWIILFFYFLHFVGFISIVYFHVIIYTFMYVLIYVCVCGEKKTAGRSLLTVETWSRGRKIDHLVRK